MAKAPKAKRVTSTVRRDGLTTTRTYSDGTVQRNTWHSEQAAKDYAASCPKEG